MNSDEQCFKLGEQVFDYLIGNLLWLSLFINFFPGTNNVDNTWFAKQLNIPWPVCAAHKHS